MNGLIIQTDRSLVGGKFPVWKVKYLSDGMSGGDFLYRARSLQSDGTLNCYEYWFSRRYHMIRAIKDFIQMHFQPFDAELPLCPPGDAHVTRTYAEGIFICHQFNPADPKEDVRGMWMIMRTVGMMGRGNKARRQWLNLKSPVIIWEDTPQVTNARIVLLGNVQKLLLSSPNFADRLTN